MTIEDELQGAADRGELGLKANEKIRRALQQTERRWIVMQVKEIAVAQQLSPSEFKELCEWIAQFTLPPEPSPSP